MKKAYVLLFDGYADWELGNVLAELRRLGKVTVVTVGFSEKPVVSMGGLTVHPAITLSHINLEDVLIFILPGGYLWEGSYPATEIHPFLARLEKAKIPMAAICAATTVFAKAGVLAGKKHTSNSREYIAKMVSGYSEGKNYVDSPATRDQHVITACGLGPVDFAMEVLNELELATPELRIVWYAAFKNGKYPDNVQHSA